MAKRVFPHDVVLGVELEGYTIEVPQHQISRKMAFYRKGIGEQGERFTRDWSIGSEYNSRPFVSVREGFFLLRSGLRKYNTSLYGRRRRPMGHRQFFLVGGWRDRFAGTHVHVSLAGRRMTRSRARRIQQQLHDHLPLLIAITANSPVWADRITEFASNRVLKGSKTYFRPVRSHLLGTDEFDEITFSPGRKRKPPTLEVRIMDSNIPEFVMAAACIIKACAMAVLSRKRPANRVSYFNYLRGRQDAARHGMQADLNWNGRWLRASDYLDRFVWVYRKELKEMDVPHEVWQAFKLLKRGWNGARILQETCERAYRKHPQTWQRRFAKQYVAAIHSILSGNSLRDFLKPMKLKTPELANVWLGRKRLRLS